MLASITLAFLLLAILSFLKLVALRSAACEAGPAPYTPDSEAWAAELDVALGLDLFSTTEEEQVDAMWDMVPMAHPWVSLDPVLPVVTKRAVTKRAKRTTLQEMCLV